MTTATTTLKPPPKRILIGGKRIHLRLPQNLLWVILGGLAAVCVVSGAYYAIFQVHYPFLPGSGSLKFIWDHLFHQKWWTLVRHGIRNLFEGVAALPLIKWIAGNWRKHWNERVPEGEIALRLLTTLIAGLALILAALWVITFGIAMIKHSTFTVQFDMPPKRTVEEEFFAIGLLIGQITSRIWKKAALGIQRIYAEASVAWWVRHESMPVWVRYPLTPPNFRELVEYLFENLPLDADGNPQVTHRAMWVRWALPILGFVFLVLLGVGVFARWFA